MKHVIIALLVAVGVNGPARAQEATPIYLEVTNKVATDLTLVSEPVTAIVELQGSGVSGLIAYYPFEGDALDASGNGNDGTINGEATFTLDRFGNPNRALSFDGIDDHVVLNNEDNFDLTEFTVVATIRAPATGSLRNGFISKGFNFGNYHLHITGSAHVQPGKAVYVHLIQNNGNWSAVVSPDPVPIDEFFHFAVTVSLDAFKGYINGRLRTNIPNPPAPALNNEPVRIGLSGHLLSEFFIGVIDDLRIYDRVLTDGEIAYLWEQIRYVTTTGIDTGNDCTAPANPCLTLAHAVSQANDGDTIDMATGTYIEPGLLIEKNLIIRGQGIVVR